MSERLLTVPEVARYLRVSRQAVYNWIADGRLPAVKIGGKAVRISENALHAFMQPILPGEIIEEHSAAHALTV